jgi:hypothetical protein
LENDPRWLTTSQKDRAAESTRARRSAWGNKAGLIDGFTRAHRHGIPLPAESAKAGELDQAWKTIEAQQAEILALGERLRALRSALDALRSSINEALKI